MTSQTGSLVAPPAWGEPKAEERRAAARAADAWTAGTPSRWARPALELRVRRARPAAVGWALAAGFAVGWAFLLLGVAGPASLL